MRLWSIHPCYLDAKGLVACWRESLLAQSCLIKGKYIECDFCNGTGVEADGIKFGIECHKCKGSGKTKTPYYNHPQLERFKENENPLGFIGAYLAQIAQEGFKRGYQFKEEKIFRPLIGKQLTVTKSQLIYEFNYLQDKLLIRCPKKYQENGQLIQTDEKNIEANLIFQVIDGQVESWEKKLNKRI